MECWIVSEKSSKLTDQLDCIKDLEFQLLESSYIELFILEDMTPEKDGFSAMTKAKGKLISLKNSSSPK